MFSRRSNESPLKVKLQDHPEPSDYFDGIEPHYQTTTRYWNTLKGKNASADDLMVNSVTAADIVNYNNVDYNNATQKMMSLSMGPQSSDLPLPPPPSMCHLTHQSFPMQHFQYTNYNAINNNMTSSFIVHNDAKVFKVQLHPNGGPLGITLAGNEDGQKPIAISGLHEGGIAANTGQIQVGDCLLAINEENVVGMALSHATKLLQTHNEVIELKLQRGNNLMTSSAISMSENLPQPQALYAKVQRRPRSPVGTAADIISNTSSSRSGGSAASDNQYKTIHVTLYKDQVYDDYGFSVSDGLYERGVYINRIRSGGPADIVGVLKPYDRIVQVSPEINPEVNAVSGN